MAKLWLGVAVGLWLLVFGFRVVLASKQAETVGAVHWMVDNQRIYNRAGFEGKIGRIAANKWLVAAELTIVRAAETVDPNILFFTGHPNERVGVREQFYLPWWLIPFWIVGVLVAKKLEFGLVLVASAWAMVSGTAGMGMYPMSIVYVWLVISGARNIWRQR